MISKDKQLLEIQRGTEEILVEEEFAQRFHQKKPLKVKVGFDPTAPDLHLGHSHHQQHATIPRVWSRDHFPDW